MLGFSGLSLLLAALLGGGSTGPSDTVTAFVNVAVIPMDRERVLAGQTVLVEHGRITALGPAGKVKVPVNAMRVDGRGQWLIPGLADMHVHGGIDPKGFLTYVANGVLTVREMAGPHDSVTQAGYLALRERVRRGELVGPTIYFASPQVRAVESPLEFASPDSAIELVRRYKAWGFDLIKIYGPPTDRATIDSFAAAARRAKIPFGGHVPNGVTTEEWLNVHPVTIEHLDRYWQLLLQPYRTPEERRTGRWQPAIDRVAAAGAKIRNGPALAALVAATKRAGVWNVPTLTIGNADTSVVRQLCYRVIRALRDAGAGMLLGTDVGSGPPAHTELQLLVHAGLTPYEALETGTRNVALAMGTVDSTGTIEIGKRADLVLLSGNPLEDIRQTQQIAGVVVGGRWLSRAALDALLLPSPASGRTP